VRQRDEGGKRKRETDAGRERRRKTCGVGEREMRNILIIYQFAEELQ
jgi:hypothetical protein